MSRLSDAERAVFGYWGALISDAARSGFTVTQTIQTANQVAKDLGQKLSFQANTAISVLYGYVRREVNAGNAFVSATAQRGINANMISTPVYARDEREMATYPLYHVRFQYEAFDASGNRISTFKTSVFPDILPSTVGELTAAVLDDAEAIAKKYGHKLLSAVPVNIMAV